MLDSCPSEIRRHLGKAPVKIKSCLILFSSMYQMFCRVESFFRFRDHCQFIPYLSINPRQTADRSTIDVQCLADRDILFSQFYAITGYCLHLFPLSAYRCHADIPGPLRYLLITGCCFFQVSVFLFALRCKSIPVLCSCHSLLLHNKMDSTDALPKVPSSVLDAQETSAGQCSPS